MGGGAGCVDQFDFRTNLREGLQNKILVEQEVLCICANGSAFTSVHRNACDPF